jgi:hypothetical protein
VGSTMQGRRFGDCGGIRMRSLMSMAFPRAPRRRGFTAYTFVEKVAFGCIWLR